MPPAHTRSAPQTFIRRRGRRGLLRADAAFGLGGLPDRWCGLRCMLAQAWARWRAQLARSQASHLPQRRVGFDRLGRDAVAFFGRMGSRADSAAAWIGILAWHWAVAGEWGRLWLWRNLLHNGADRLNLDVALRGVQEVQG